MTTNEVARVYDTLMSAPGMNDAVRVDIRVSRKNLLLLNHVLAVAAKEETSDLLKHVGSEHLEALKAVGQEFLQKGGLVDFNEKFLGLGKEK